MRSFKLHTLIRNVGYVLARARPRQGTSVRRHDLVGKRRKEISQSRRANDGLIKMGERLHGIRRSLGLVRTQLFLTCESGSIWSRHLCFCVKLSRSNLKNRYS